LHRESDIGFIRFIAPLLLNCAKQNKNLHIAISPDKDVLGEIGEKAKALVIGAVISR